MSGDSARSIDQLIDRPMVNMQAVREWVASLSPEQMVLFGCIHNGPEARRRFVASISPEQAALLVQSTSVSDADHDRGAQS